MSTRLREALYKPNNAGSSGHVKNGNLAGAVMELERLQGIPREVRPLRLSFQNPHDTNVPVLDCRLPSVGYRAHDVGFAVQQVFDLVHAEATVACSTALLVSRP